MVPKKKKNTVKQKTKVYSNKNENEVSPVPNLK